MRFDCVACLLDCSVRTRTGVVNTAVIGLNDGDVGSVKLIDDCY